MYWLVLVRLGLGLGLGLFWFGLVRGMIWLEV